MTTIDKIRAKIRRLYAEDSDRHIVRTSLEALSNLMDFLDTLEEPVNEDLEEEVKRYYSENFSYITSDNPTLSILTNIARHFAEWMKAKMMEGVVEGEVYKFGEVAYVKERNNAELTKYLSQFNNGDKVKIIVVYETNIR